MLDQSSKDPKINSRIQNDYFRTIAGSKQGNWNDAQIQRGLRNGLPDRSYAPQKPHEVKNYQYRTKEIRN